AATYGVRTVTNTIAAAATTAPATTGGRTRGVTITSIDSTRTRTARPVREPVSQMTPSNGTMDAASSRDASPWTVFQNSRTRGTLTRRKIAFALSGGTPP